MLTLIHSQATALPHLLFVDDHPLYRNGVQLSLLRAMPELTVDVASSAEQALDFLATHADLDLCLADVRLPGMDGLAFVEAVGIRWPTVARGLLCGEPTADIVRRARMIGCVACLSKARDIDMLIDALSELFQGGVVFDAIDAGGPCLPDKRRLVLGLGADGKSNKEIARALGITERTVKHHWAAIFHQLGAANRAEAINRAHQKRLI
jgi:DNA-binding NarL/FixJ family response regulator